MSYDLLAASSVLTGYLFMILMVAGSAILAYGIYQIVSESRHGEHKRVVDRMRGVSGRDEKNKDKALASILRQSAMEDQAAQGIHAFLKKLSYVSRLQITLDQAALNWTASRVLLNLGLGAVVAFGGLMLLNKGILTALGCGLGIFFIPQMWISMRRKKRMKRLTYQLPDVFAMMGQALRAGHSLASSIQLIHEQMPDPIGTEFGRVFHEQNLGMKMEDALLAMANRVDQLDVRFFVTAVLIQRQTGGDLAEVLDKIGAVIRERIELFGMVMGLTAEGRLSGWVLFALPFIVFLAVLALNPNYGNQLLEDPRGKIILGIALGMQLMGLAMIRWIVNIKV